MSTQPTTPPWSDEDEAAWAQLRQALRAVAACDCFEHNTDTGTPLYDAAAFDNGFAPLPDDVTVTRYTAHTPALDAYPADIRVRPIGGDW